MSDIINTSLLKSCAGIFILIGLISFGVIFMVNGYNNKLDRTESINRTAIQEIKPRDYQIDIVQDTIFVYDRNRLVGRVINKDNSLDSLILSDNQ